MDSGFLASWNGAVVPILIVSCLTVFGLLLGISMVVSYGLMMTRDGSD